MTFWQVGTETFSAPASWPQLSLRALTAGRNSLRRRRQEITIPLLIPFLFCNPSPALTIFENTAPRLLLQWLKKKNLCSRENCLASPIFLWL